MSCRRYMFEYLCVCANFDGKLACISLSHLHYFLSPSYDVLMDPLADGLYYHIINIFF